MNRMSSTSILRIGPYRLLNLINNGQSSRLWQAINDENRQYVAIKTLLNQNAKDKSQVDLLKWEYTVAEKFDHPLVISIRDFEWDKPTKMPYLVMEWFPAPNVKMLVNQGYDKYAPDLEMILSGMLGSLMYLHEQGWVHRDIKPDNFLFDPELGFKLLDFALAKKIPGGLAKIFSMKAKTQGTASYMSPEQIRGLPTDPRADIYSLGCTFYELLTGKLPYAGNSMAELLQKHIAAPIPSVTARNKNVSQEMGNILRVMLAKKAEDRPGSIKELGNLLQNVRLFRRPPSAGDVV